MSKKLKILYYSPHPHLNYQSASGYGTHMREMVKAFRGLGHEVSLLIMGGTEWVEGKTNAPSSSLKSKIRNLVPTKIWESLKDFSLLKFDRNAQSLLEERIKEFQPDFIFERANYFQLSGIRAAEKLKVPHFYEFNSPFIDQRKFLQGESFTIGYAEKMEAQQLKSTDCSFVVSSALKNYFEKQYKVPSNKMRVLPNAIDPEKILEPDKERELSLRAKHGIKVSETVIGFVGSIFPWHGVDILVDAFTKLAVTRNQLKLLVVGDGEILGELKSKVSNSGMDNIVVFTGKVPHVEVFPLIEIMDITVLAKSHWYGSPVKIFEYGAIGKPIIATNNGPVNDVMKNKVDGLLIEENSEALLKALEEMLDKPKERKKYALNFNEKILKNHVWEQNAKKVMEVFNEIGA